MNSQSLSLASLSLKIGQKKILSNINLEVSTGEIVVILGPSGVGKTSLLKIIAGFQKPSEGEIENKNKTIYLPQNAELMPWRSAIESALLPLEINKNINDENTLKALELFKLFGLENDIHTSSEHLSGVMKQRVLLIQTLLCSASLLLLDEPLSAIDIIQKVEIVEAMKNCLKKSCTSAIIVTHSLNEALALADTIYVLNTEGLSRLDFEIEPTNKNLKKVAFSKNYSEVTAKFWDTMNA